MSKKWAYLEITELQLRHTSYGQLQASPTNKGEEHYFVEKEEKVEKSFFERKAIGESQEFRMVMFFLG